MAATRLVESTAIGWIAGTLLILLIVGVAASFWFMAHGFP